MNPYSFILLTLYLKPGRCWKVINSAADVHGLARVWRQGTAVPHLHYLIGIGIKHVVTVQAQRSRNWLWMQLCLHSARAGSSSSGSELTTRSYCTMERASGVLMLISQLLELASLGIFKHPIKLVKQWLGWFKATEKLFRLFSLVYEGKRRGA